MGVAHCVWVGRLTCCPKVFKISMHSHYLGTWTGFNTPYQLGIHDDVPSGNMQASLYWDSKLTAQLTTMLAPCISVVNLSDVVHMWSFKLIFGPSVFLFWWHFTIGFEVVAKNTTTNHKTNFPLVHLELDRNHNRTVVTSHTGTSALRDSGFLVTKLWYLLWNYNKGHFKLCHDF